jgi:hypothetical protein
MEHDKVWEIIHLIRTYVPPSFGEIGWVATQNPLEDGLTAFTIGRGHAAIHYTDLDRRDDAFIREVATQILGYPPDSPQDIERRRNEAQSQIANLRTEIEEREKRLEYWISISNNLISMQDVGS